ncbi:dephospho-CoA kinase [Candidatus Acetothermia bacterium]|nr:dephospho-CoA kinase [Candidatus Acetothermia bacterium]
MKVIGLTGGIGCGKSTVARELSKERGVESCDCDRIAWEIYRLRTAPYQQLIRRFGREILTSSGEIDRTALGRLIFSDKAAQADLNAIVHPAVMEQVQHHININKRRGTELLIVEGALLLTSPHVDPDLFDIIIQLELSRSQQLARLREQHRKDQTEVERIIDLQRAMTPYSRPDYIIDASGTVAEVVGRIKMILAKEVIGDGLKQDTK